MARRARLKDLQAQIKGALLSAVIIDDLPGLSAISSWILTSFSLRTTPPLFSLFFYPPNPHPSLECHFHPTPCFNVQRLQLATGGPTLPKDARHEGEPVAAPLAMTIVKSRDARGNGTGSMSREPTTLDDWGSVS